MDSCNHSPDTFSQKLDAINLLVNKCSHNLSTNLLTTSILSRDLMGLTTDIFDYDTRADQINSDSRNLKEFSNKLESLSVKIQFVESQIDALEQQNVSKKSKRHSALSISTSNSSSITPFNYNNANSRINHIRLSSVNSMKDQFLDLKTTEDTLQNLYQEFFHLKKIYLQFQSKDYLFGEDGEEDEEADDFNMEFEKANNSLHNNNHQHQSSISTAYTSLYDESHNLKPIKCLSKSRKRLSGLQGGSLYMSASSNNNKLHYSNNSIISSSSKSYNIDQVSNDMYDNIPIDLKICALNSKRNSDETSTEDLLKPSPASKSNNSSGLGIYQGNGRATNINNLDDVNIGFQFPKDISYNDGKKDRHSMKILKKHQFNEADFKRQTMHWLSQFNNWKNNTNSDHGNETISSITLLSPSNSFHPSIDITKSSQALLLDMMYKVKEKERNLEREINQRRMETAAENFLQSFSRNLSNNFQIYTSTSHDATSAENNEDEDDDTDTPSKSIHTISRIFSSFFETPQLAVSEPSVMETEPILENGIIHTEDLNEALQTELSIS